MKMFATSFLKVICGFQSDFKVSLMVRGINVACLPASSGKLKYCKKKKTKNYSPHNQIFQAHHHAQFILHGGDVGRQLGQVAQRLRTKEDKVELKYQFYRVIYNQSSLFGLPEELQIAHPDSGGPGREPARGDSPGH